MNPLLRCRATQSRREFSARTVWASIWLSRVIYALKRIIHTWSKASSAAARLHELRECCLRPWQGAAFSFPYFFCSAKKNRVAEKRNDTFKFKMDSRFRGNDRVVNTCLQANIQADSSFWEPCQLNFTTSCWNVNTKNEQPWAAHQFSKAIRKRYRAAWYLWML